MIDSILRAPMTFRILASMSVLQSSMTHVNHHDYAFASPSFGSTRSAPGTGIVRALEEPTIRTLLVIDDEAHVRMLFQIAVEYSQASLIR